MVIKEDVVIPIRDEVVRRVKKVIKHVFEMTDDDLEGVTEETLIVSPVGLDADEIDLVELVADMEEEFHIELTDENVDKAHTVGDFVDLILTKLEEVGSGQSGTTTPPTSSF